MRRIIIAQRLRVYISRWVGIGDPIPENIERDMHMLARTEITLLRHQTLLCYLIGQSLSLYGKATDRSPSETCL
jgi:hypothetical protein